MTPTRADILAELAPHPLAIWPEWLQSHASADQGAPLAAVSARSTSGSGPVSVIPVTGLILPKWHWLEGFGIATSLTTLRERIAHAVEDPATRAVVLDVDSPGGVTTGLHEFATDLRAMRGRKPIIAHADFLAASAAYWIAASTDEVIASPSALVGSVGVYSMHVDQSKALDKAGIAITLIHAGEDKVLGNPMEPLSKRGRGYLQGLVDDAYRMFLRDVAAGRSTSPQNVQLDYGRGRVLTASAALAAGVVDRVRPIEETVQAVRPARRARMARELELLELGT